MVVEKTSNSFHERICAVNKPGALEAYLRVEVLESFYERGADGVDMQLVWLDGHGEWNFSDRADPDDSDAKVELNQGLINWYGEFVRIKYWLQEREARHVYKKHFAWILE